MVSYLLPATMIDPKLLYASQQPATYAFLGAMGYARTFPRSVAYAPQELGGLGLRHLGQEQGVQKVLQVLKHLRTNTTIGKLIQLQINTMQLTSGIFQPLLQDTCPLPWQENDWITTTRTFLHMIQGQIHLQNPWLLPTRRTSDRHIMEDIATLNIPDHDKQRLSAMRLYLRISTLAEITEHTGKEILSEYLTPSPNEHHCPLNQLGSTHQWPTQPEPSKQTWKLWKKTLQTLYTRETTTILRQPLGTWLPTYEQESGNGNGYGVPPTKPYTNT